MKKIESDLMRTEKKLGNRDFMDRAPEAVVQKEKDRQAEMGLKLQKIKESLKQLDKSG